MILNPETDNYPVSIVGTVKGSIYGVTRVEGGLQERLLYQDDELR